MSDPEARYAVPEASAAPEPPEEPPGPKSGFHGFRVMPHRSEWVKAAQLNSGVVVRAWTIAPAPRTRSATGWVSSDTSPSVSKDP